MDAVEVDKQIISLAMATDLVGRHTGMVLQRSHRSQ